MFLNLFILPGAVVCFVHSIVSGTILTLTDTILSQGGQSTITFKVQGLTALVGGEGRVD